MKLCDRLLIKEAVPFALSERFLRRPFHIENNERTILCNVSRFLAAFVILRFMLSCNMLKSKFQCILSIDQ